MKFMMTSIFGLLVGMSAQASLGIVKAYEKLQCSSLLVSSTVQGSPGRDLRPMDRTLNYADLEPGSPKMETAIYSTIHGGGGNDGVKFNAYIAKPQLGGDAEIQMLVSVGGQTAYSSKTLREMLASGNAGTVSLSVPESAALPYIEVGIVCEIAR